MATAAQAAKTAATQANTLATNADKAATAARKVATAAETKALKLAAQAEAIKATAGATKATQARKAADALATVASQKVAAADTARTIATKANTAALTADTTATKAKTLASTKLGKVYALLLKAQATSTASLAGQTVAMKAATIAKGTLTLGTKGLAVGFKAMSVAIKAIPIFGWILAGVTAVIAAVTLLVRWFNRVGEEYQAVGEAADSLAERQQQLAETSAMAADNFQHEVRVLEARVEQYEHLAECVDHATAVYNTHRREIDRLSMEYTELGLGLEDTRSKIADIEDQLSDGSGRRRRDSRALNDALDTLRATETAYVDAMEANRRMQTDVAAGIEVHAEVLADLERQQQEASAAMAAATAEMEKQVWQAEEWERAQTQAVDRMNTSFENYKRLTTNAFRTVNENVAISVSDMTSNLIANAAAVEEWSVNLALLTEKGLDEGLIEQLRAAGPEAAATVRELVNASDEELEALNDAFADSTRVAVESMQRELDPLGVTNSAEELIDAVATTILENEAMENALIDKVQAGFDAFSNSIDNAGFDTAGNNMVQGAVVGVYQGEGDLFRAGVWMVDTLHGGITHAAQINSPAKLFEDPGGYMMDGVIAGVYSREQALKDACGDMVDSMADGMYSRAGDVEKACNRISGIMTRNFRGDYGGSIRFGTSAFSAQAGFDVFSNLSSDGEGFAPSPIDRLRSMGDSAYQPSGGMSVNYNPTYNIEGGGFNVDELKSMLGQRDSEGEAKLKQLILQIMDDRDYRKVRMSNA